jgi:hypothetical protein
MRNLVNVKKVGKLSNIGHTSLYIRELTQARNSVNTMHVENLSEVRSQQASGNSYR